MRDQPQRLAGLNNRRETRFAAVALVAWLLGGCDSSDPTPGRCIPVEPTRVQVRPTDPVRTYLVDRIDFPSTATQAYKFGFDIDQDELGRPDNALGNILSAFSASGGVDIEGATTESIALGQLLHLLRIHSDGFVSSDAATLTLFHGIDADGDSTDNFSGSEVFGIDTARGTGRLGGSMAGEVLRASGGELPFALAFAGDEAIYPLTLAVAQFEATVTDSGLEGHIGGAIPHGQVLESLLPLFAVAFNEVIERDCPNGICKPWSFGDLVLTMDEDADGVITVDDLTTSSIAQSLFAPDVDIYDEDGTLSLQCDDYNDALSVGFGFTAVPVGNL